MIEGIDTALKPRGTTRNHDTPVKTRTGFRQWGCFQVEVDVAGNEKIQQSITVIIYKSRPRTPARAITRDSCFLCHLRESTVAAVVIQGIFAVTADKKIVISIVVIITDAYALPPPSADQSGLLGNIRKCAVAVIAIEAICRT